MFQDDEEDQIARLRGRVLAVVVLLVVGYVTWHVWSGLGRVQ